jgi:adenine-specific DNA-methyltransferase
MNKKTALGQFYTPNFIAKTIVSLALELIPAPDNAIELAAGEGHLLLALLEHSPLCKVVAIDIDAYNVALLKAKKPEIFVLEADATSPLEAIEGKKFELALGNPPFLANIVVNSYIQNIILKNLNIQVSIGQNIRAEYVFLCQYLNLLADDGLLAIILPETVVSGVRAKDFRKGLLNTWWVEEIFEIDGSPFSLTEAKTHVLFVRNRKDKNNNIKVSRIISTGEVVSTKQVEYSMLYERMDFSFLSTLGMSQGGKRLGDYAKVFRGKKTHKNLREQGLPFKHTNNLMKEERFFLFNTDHHDDLAMVGDILMCRVGARVAGKAVLFNGQPIEISDCLYSIRFVELSVRDEFLTYLNSDAGVSQIKSLLRGVCSRYITKEDILNFRF